MEKAIQKIQTEVRSLPLTEGENETGIPYTALHTFRNYGLYGRVIFHIEN